MTLLASPVGRTRIEAIEPAPALFLHCAFFLTGSRLLSDETFRLVNFQGQESASEPFEFQLELHANSASWKGTPLVIDEVIGRPVTVGIAYPECDPESAPSRTSYTNAQLQARFQRAVRGAGCGKELSLFNGIVTAFSIDIPGVYRATMKPALWKLTLANHYRVFRQRNVRDTIADLLDRYRIAYSMDAISGQDNPAIARIQDWLQAGETDFDFLRRLMGKAHLYYYIVHSGNAHKLVFANRPAYPPVLPGNTPLRYACTGEDELGMAQADVVYQYNYQQSLVPSCVRGIFTRQEAAWEDDAVARFQSFVAQDRPEDGERPFNQYKIYQYGCSTEEVRFHTDKTSLAMQSSAIQLSGSSYCAHFRAGHQFGLVDDASVERGRDGPIRPSLKERRFVLTMVKHQASADGAYQNDFQATDAQGLIAAFSVQETQLGNVLAKVVAHSAVASEDWRFYTTGMFDPETSTLSDTESASASLRAMGVLVRFSTDPEDAEPVWIKLAPHMQVVPEVGTTVNIVRSQDESELPEVQSIVQSNGSMVVMPSGWTANTHVGSNYSTSYGDGKSIRFGKTSSANLDNAVGIVCGPYDTGLYSNTSYAQGASYSFSAAVSRAGTAACLPDVYGPYGGQGQGDLLSASEAFGSTFHRQEATVTSSVSTVGTAYSKSTVDLSDNHSVTTTQNHTSSVETSNSTSSIENNNSSSTVGASDTSEKIGRQNSEQTIGESKSSTSTGKQNHSATVGVSQHLSLNGVADAIQLTGASNSVSLTGMANSASAIGTRMNAEAVGMSVNASMTGVHLNESLVGISNNAALTGLASDESITGASDRLSATGISASINCVGIKSDIDCTDAGTHISLKGIDLVIQAVMNGVHLDIGPEVVRNKVSGPEIHMPIILLIM
ncbi:contractile injection system protein, VgrG/Pvc8 family [Massilia sp. CCM 9210]|uniref:contractile injection system protein, VgrG/Pvc8 family n=1 Tax=Massilia scottii TaxID=3057166 RepID=UPI0027964526|nr:contractile injection system protein, VgrG/Pvc8 family [Massilia sp. CCM 9210]MDQ1812069.1 contractile injection system protein, VgrG/Pvc8 family [Massilia sp. CCM 9210]